MLEFFLLRCRSSLLLLLRRRRSRRGFFGFPLFFLLFFRFRIGRRFPCLPLSLLLAVRDKVLEHRGETGGRRRRRLDLGQGATGASGVELGVPLVPGLPLPSAGEQRLEDFERVVQSGSWSRHVRRAGLPGRVALHRPRFFEKKRNRHRRKVAPTMKKQKKQKVVFFSFLFLPTPFSARSPFFFSLWFSARRRGT